MKIQPETLYGRKHSKERGTTQTKDNREVMPQASLQYQLEQLATLGREWCNLLLVPAEEESKTGKRETTKSE
jgi:hypothetical protein